MQNNAIRKIYASASQAARGPEYWVPGNSSHLEAVAAADAALPSNHIFLHCNVLLGKRRVIGLVELALEVVQVLVARVVACAAAGSLLKRGSGALEEIAQTTHLGRAHEAAIRPTVLRANLYDDAHCGVLFYNSQRYPVYKQTKKCSTSEKRTRRRAAGNGHVDGNLEWKCARILLD